MNDLTVTKTEVATTDFTEVATTDFTEVATEHNQDGQVPEPVRRLFANIIGVLPTVELDDRTQTLLFLALLNCHMAYSLASGYLLNNDPSVQDE